MGGTAKEVSEQIEIMSSSMYGIQKNLDNIRDEIRQITKKMT